MSGPYSKDFDSILSDQLTDYSNLDPAPDTSIGSMVYVGCATHSSALWGAYKYQDFISTEIFPDTCSTTALNHFGSDYGIPRLTGENDNDYAGRILSFMRQPPAGGTATDYQNWALATPATPANLTETFVPSAVVGGGITTTQEWQNGSIVQFSTTNTLPSPLVTATNYVLADIGPTSVQVYDSTFTTLIPLTDGGIGVHTITPQSTTLYTVAYARASSPSPGAVVVVILPNDPSIIGGGAMQTLANAAFTYIDARRPVTASLTQVVGAVPVTANINITVKPITSDVTQMQSDITAYINTLAPGDTLYVSKLSSLCIQDGAYDAVVTLPASDIVPTIYQVVRPGVITVTASA